MFGRKVHDALLQQRHAVFLGLHKQVTSFSSIKFFAPSSRRTPATRWMWVGLTAWMTSTAVSRRVASRPSPEIGKKMVQHAALWAGRTWRRRPSVTRRSSGPPRRRWCFRTSWLGNELMSTMWKWECVLWSQIWRLTDRLDMSHWFSAMARCKIGDTDACTVMWWQPVHPDLR